jgi:class 3 adenylate cyclase
LVVHAGVYAVVNGFLVAVWVLTSGSPDELREVLDAPADALDHGFWPIWPMLGWGVGLGVHAVVSLLTLPRRMRRRRLRAKGVPRLPALPALPHIPVRSSPRVVHDATPRKRWLVVMFTDICDSTAENERLGDEVWHAVLTRYRDVVRRVLASRDGKEIATAGDGFLISFDSPSDAVLAGVDIQRALAEARAQDPTTPRTRIGLHAGDVVDDGSDVLGHVVNLASRVSAAAEPDEILVTEPVADQLVGSLRIEDRGLQALKGVTQPRHLLAVRWEA